MIRRMNWLFLVCGIVFSFVILGCSDDDPVVDGDADLDFEAVENPVDGDIEMESEVEDPWAGHFLFSDRVMNIAHRGGGDLRPENTLLAYQNSLDEGADILEMDVHATKDGVIVVSHDATVDRQTDGSGYIREMTFEQVRALDAGYTFTEDGGQSYPYRGQGVQIPTLEEVFTAHSDAYYTLEIKQSDPPIVDEVLAIIREYHMESNVVMGAFSEVLLSEIREKAPELLTGFATEEVITFSLLRDDDLDDYLPPGEFMQLPISAAQPATLERARHFGIKAHIWTVNDEQEMNDLLDLGVDGIMSDNPKLLQSVLVQRGLRE